MRKYEDDFSQSEFENMRNLKAKKVKVKNTKIEVKPKSRHVVKNKNSLINNRVSKLLIGLLIVLILLVAISGILLLKLQKDGAINSSVNTPTPIPTMEVVPTQTPQPTPVPTASFDTSGYDTTAFGSITQVVNKQHGLTAADVPSDQVFVGVNATIEKMTIRKEANEALIPMFEQAKADGIDLYVNEAYVSYYYQNDLYTNYAKLVGKEFADMVTPHQGFSEHQTGLAVDIVSRENGNWTHLNSSLRSKHDASVCEESQAALWLKEHAHEYGFIQRYPEGKESITGYYGQWWHYRYVGNDLANYMHDNDLCMEEVFGMEAATY